MASGSRVIDGLVAGLQTEYPILEEQQEQALVVTPHGGWAAAPGGGRVWKLRSADDEWQLSVADTFLTLHTTAYSNRDDVVQRLAHAWGQFSAVASPPFFERIGVRYVNRVTEEAILEDLQRLVRPEVLGVFPVPLEAGTTMLHTLSDTLFRFDSSDVLQVRTGILPEGVVLDPILTPTPGRSWILDLDASRTMQQRIEPDGVSEQASSLASRVYQYFRWAVTPQFIERFRERA